MPVKPQTASSLLKLATHQHISREGKTYALNYPGITLFIPRCAPLNIPASGVIFRASVSAVRKFARDHDMVVWSVSEDRMALYLAPSVEDASFPRAYILLNEKYTGSDIAVEDDPQLIKIGAVSRTSTLDEFKKNSKIAMLLKEYALYSYAQNGKVRFTVDPDHSYDYEELGPVIVPDNGIIYRNDKIVVPSEEIKSRLLYHVNNTVKYIPKIVETYREKRILENYYETIEDFHHHRGQLVFPSPYELMYWIARKDEILSYDVTNVLDPEVDYPYFYSSYHVANGELSIVQNVKDGDLSRALNVVRAWSRAGINLGYDTDPLEEGLQIDYDVLVPEGTVKRTKSLSVMRYPNGSYAAILFFE
jgi:hypothetical protein